MISMRWLRFTLGTRLGGQALQKPAEGGV